VWDLGFRVCWTLWQKKKETRAILIYDVTSSKDTSSKDTSSKETRAMLIYDVSSFVLKRRCMMLCHSMGRRQKNEVCKKQKRGVKTTILRTTFFAYAPFSHFLQR
jgi:hypothetical protein